MANCLIISLVLSAFISFLYVGSLYCWPNQTHRDDPKTIKRRFISVWITIIISTIVLIVFNGEYNVWTVVYSLGLVFPSDQSWTQLVFDCVFVPLLQTSVLFLGPIVLCLTQWSDFELNYFNVKNIFHLIFIRNYIMAPITEELIFRGVLSAFLVNCWSLGATVIISSLLFGFAHSHHYFFETNSLRRVNGWAAVEQMVYTSLFGMYASILYFRSKLIVTPIIIHSFCNLMGFPDIQAINGSKIAFISTIIGFISWIFTLFYVFSRL